MHRSVSPEVTRPVFGSAVDGTSRPRPKSRRKVSAHRVVLTTLYLMLTALFLRFLLSGLSYYVTPVIERPHHELYWSLKPGGQRGIGFGLLGSGMMILLLAYSLRKRVAFLRRLGPASAWLDYHIMLGIFGPLFILLHSSFKVNGIVALSFWSMVVVTLSGVVGRYLYLQIPRSEAGDELTLAQVQKLDEEMSRSLVERFRLPARTVAQLEAIAEQGVDRDGSVLALLWKMSFDRFALHWRLYGFRRKCRRRYGTAAMRRFERVVKRKVLLRRRLLLWQRLRELFHYWHVFHKPFAIVMYLFMVLHVAVAWITGYWRIAG